jgi:hypothetical protein
VQYTECSVEKGGYASVILIQTGKCLQEGTLVPPLLCLHRQKGPKAACSHGFVSVYRTA